MDGQQNKKNMPSGSPKRLAEPQSMFYLPFPAPDLNTEPLAVHLSLERSKFRMAIPLGEVCRRTFIGILKRTSLRLPEISYLVC